ncbi:hypothetical protein, partial [Agromyces neolithicus]|uniref:hypothetical protein n=1 Tax=Agromyces neolithicus TaxID=269420 RepID=UPI0031E10A12
MVDTDGVDELTEAFDGQLRMLVTTATHMGDLGARVMADRNRAMRDEAERNSRELAARFEAERAAARAELAEVYRSEWWDRADVEAIANKYELARAWVGEEPEALRAELHMREELRTRYGLDVDHPGADPAAVQEAIDRRKQEQEREENEQRRAAADKAEAAELSVVADREDARAAAATRDLEQQPEGVDLNAAAIAERTHESASESA